MSLIFDHLIVALVTMTVIIVVTAIQVTTTQNGIEQVSAHAAKTKALSFGEWIEDDIVTLGANFGRNRYRFEPPVLDADSNTTEFVFYSDSLLSGGDTLRYFTRYRLFTVDSLEEGGEVRPLFQAVRDFGTSTVENGTAPTPSVWQEDGRSVSTLSFFEISLLRSNGEVTTDVVVADYIRVRFALVPEYALARGYLSELYWTTTLKVRPFWQPPPEAPPAEA